MTVKEQGALSPAKRHGSAQREERDLVWRGFIRGERPPASCKLQAAAEPPW